MKYTKTIISALLYCSIHIYADEQNLNRESVIATTDHLDFSKPIKLTVSYRTRQDPFMNSQLCSFGHKYKSSCSATSKKNPLDGKYDLYVKMNINDLIDREHYIKLLDDIEDHFKGRDGELSFSVK